MNVTNLWLPILASGLATHVLSTLAWTVMPHHKPEWRRLPVENELQELLTGNVPREQYMIPFAANGTEAQSDEFKQRQAKGTGMLVLWKEPLNMPAAIIKTLLFYLFTAFVLGYLASIAIPAGATFLTVFRFVTTCGLLAYCFAHFPHVFWFRRKIGMELLDGIIFSLVVGLIFASLWP